MKTKKIRNSSKWVTKNLLQKNVSIDSLFFLIFGPETSFPSSSFSSRVCFCSVLIFFPFRFIFALGSRVSRGEIEKPPWLQLNPEARDDRFRLLYPGIVSLSLSVKIAYGRWAEHARAANGEMKKAGTAEEWHESPVERCCGIHTPIYVRVYSAG